MQSARCSCGRSLYHVYPTLINVILQNRYMALNYDMLNPSLASESLLILSPSFVKPRR